MPRRGLELVAAILEIEVIAPKLPPKDIVLAWITPFSTHTDVTFPLISVTTWGSEALTPGVEIVVGGELQLICAWHGNWDNAIKHTRVSNFFMVTAI